MANSLKKGIAPKYLFPIVALYATAVGLIDWMGIEAVYSTLKNAGVAGIAGVAFLIIQDLFPRAAKEAVVFWRLNNRPPGFRAFSVVAKRDERIDQAKLRSLLPVEHMEPSQENAEWYSWLKAVEGDAGIADDHHRFLALRDSTALLLLLAIITPPLAVVFGWLIPNAAVITGVCLIGYLLTMISARNAAVRFVGNVIARKVATSTAPNFHAGNSG